MKEGWEKIYSTDQLYKAEIAKSLLEEHQMPAVIVNKKDSSYIVLGEIEVYTRQENVLKAINLLKKQGLWI